MPFVGRSTEGGMCFVLVTLCVRLLAFLSVNTFVSGTVNVAYHIKKTVIKLILIGQPIQFFLHKVVCCIGAVAVTSRTGCHLLLECRIKFLQVNEKGLEVWISRTDLCNITLQAKATLRKNATNRSNAKLTSMHSSSVSRAFIRCSNAPLNRGKSMWRAACRGKRRRKLRIRKAHDAIHKPVPNRSIFTAKATNAANVMRITFISYNSLMHCVEQNVFT